MTKTRIARARVRVAIHWYLQGSVIKGTVDSDGSAPDLEVESDDDPENCRRALRERLLAEQMVVRPTPSRARSIGRSAVCARLAREWVLRKELGDAFKFAVEMVTRRRWRQIA
jgi:hypothetical protein